MQVLKCSDCHLMFRYPLDEPDKARWYYDSQYAERTATDLPDETSLRTLVGRNFEGSSYDQGEKIRLIKAFKSGGRILDYGSSWGYTLHQLQTAGFNAVGIEIAERRAAYGREHLGVRIISAADEIAALAHGSFDIILANHVLEHLPRLAPTFDRFYQLLRPDGLVIAFVPNCGGINARVQGASWGPMTGRYHPLALDAEFFERNLPRHGFEITMTCDPYDVKTVNAALTSGDPPALDGDELLVIARRTTARQQFRAR